MGILSPKAIGIDLYDIPLNAVNSDGEILGKTNISNVIKNTTTVAIYDETLGEIIDSKKYWGDFELTQELLKYAINNLRSKLIKPKIVASVPHDITKGPFGKLFKRMIQEAAITAGGREAYMIENITCAAIGADLPIKEHKRMWVMYSNEWCTYLYMTYAGAVVVSEIIQKPYNEINILEIYNTLKSMSAETPVDVSKLFNILNLDANVMKSLEANWLRPSENKIYLIVPDSMKLKYGQWMEDYQLIYADNYENCIIEGLRYIIKEMSYIMKPKYNKSLL